MTTVKCSLGVGAWRCLTHQYSLALCLRLCEIYGEIYLSENFVYASFLKPDCLISLHTPLETVQDLQSLEEILASDNLNNVVYENGGVNMACLCS